MILSNPMDINELSGRKNEAVFSSNVFYRDKDKKYMYYSESNVESRGMIGMKKRLEEWYQTNIVNGGYDSKVAEEQYCEQAKVALSSNHISNSGAAMKVYTEYTPNFRCEKDNNGKGPLNLKIGLITYDEVVYAGGHPDYRSSNYLSSPNYNVSTWTMSPAGVYTYNSNWFVSIWRMQSSTVLDTPTSTETVRPVINLKAEVKISSGDGTKSNPFTIQ